MFKSFWNQRYTKRLKEKGKWDKEYVAGETELEIFFRKQKVYKGVI